MKAKGPLLLVITAVLWGLAFTAQTQAAQNVDPFTFNASRNLVGALVLSAVIAARRPKRALQEGPATCEGAHAHDAYAAPSAQDGPDSRGHAHSKAKRVRVGQRPSGRMRPGVHGRSGHGRDDRPAPGRRDLARAGIACGVALGAASFLQQAGISAYPDGAAASGRSGFVTATYMVMVALAAACMGKRAHPLVFISVGVALLGMYLLCVPDGLGNVYAGDWLVLASAAGYAVHILVIDRFPRVDGVRLSRMQLVVAAALSIAGALAFERPNLADILAAAVPILYAGIMSDGIAYTLQIVGQKTTDPTVASVIMSFEAVFAALGGWMLLGEQLTSVEAAGCAIVLAAVLLAQVPALREARGVGNRPDPGR